MKTIYKSRYQANKNKSDYEVKTVKCDGGFMNLTYQEYKLWGYNKIRITTH